MTKTITSNQEAQRSNNYEMPNEVVLAKGLIERIGLKILFNSKFDDRSSRKL